MSHSFSQVPQAKIQRSTFDRSHGYKTTFDAGNLVPFFLDEVLPGDTFNCKVSAFARLATPIYPIMDNMFMDTHFFFVPTRLVWDNFKKFMGEQTNPGDSIDYTVPVTGMSGVHAAAGGILDYMGLPTGVSIQPNILPIRAYWLIYDEWFRDQNLQNSAGVAKDDTGTVITNSTDYTWNGIAKRGKRHDYFTSCLPWPQKGDSIDLPLGDKAPIAMDTLVNSNVSVYSTAYSEYRSLDTDMSLLNLSATAGTEVNNIYADLSTATAATINQLRQAFQIQKLLERDARGGTRYIEIIRSHFGVTSPDARVQRPEYLGGGSSAINITPIAQTSETTTTPQGNLAAMGTASFTDHGFTKSFTEHGYVIGIVSVRADLTYQQGVNRMWSRSTRYDFFWPSLAHIGEQAVLNKEIYANGTATDDQVFGYQERYAEYRYKPSQITGQLRSSHATSLDAWHLSQDFAGVPILNATFIEENPPIDRCIAVPSEPHFIFDSYISLRCARPIPLYSVPGLIDHF